MSHFFELDRTLVIVILFRNPDISKAEINPQRFDGEKGDAGRIPHNQEGRIDMTEMDYFAQKPEMDMTSFFQGKGLNMAEQVPATGCAPPPKDTYWVAPTEAPAEED
jgi:hypothetical protein